MIDIITVFIDFIYYIKDCKIITVEDLCVACLRQKMGD